jgi:hypothetical protein
MVEVEVKGPSVTIPCLLRHGPRHVPSPRVVAEDEVYSSFMTAPGSRFASLIGTHAAKEPANAAREAVIGRVLSGTRWG